MKKPHPFFTIMLSFIATACVVHRKFSADTDNDKSALNSETDQNETRLKLFGREIATFQIVMQDKEKLAEKIEGCDGAALQLHEIPKSKEYSDVYSGQDSTHLQKVKYFDASYDRVKKIFENNYPSARL